MSRTLRHAWVPGVLGCLWDCPGLWDVSDTQTCMGARCTRMFVGLPRTLGRLKHSDVHGCPVYYDVCGTAQASGTSQTLRRAWMPGVLGCLWDCPGLWDVSNTQACMGARCTRMFVGLPRTLGCLGHSDMHGCPVY